MQNDENTKNLTPQDIEAIVQQVVAALLDPKNTDRPQILDSLKNSTHTYPSTYTPTRAKRTRTHTTRKLVYMPEVDYLIAITRMRGEFMEGAYSSTGRINFANKSIRRRKNVSMPSALDPDHALTSPLSAPFYYGYEVFKGDDYSRAAANVVRDATTEFAKIYASDYIIPATALKRDLVYTYGAWASMDFRIASHNQNKNTHESGYNPKYKSRTYYMRGVSDGTVHNTPLEGNASCYVFDMSVPFTTEIIDNTWEEWERMSDESVNRRVLTRESMSAVLNRMERALQGHEPVMGAYPCAMEWEVLMEGAEDYVPMHSDCLNPRKIRLRG